MGICWYCHWGWPKRIADIYEQALAKLEGDDNPLLYGPSHIVWADENWDDSVEWCLEHFDEYKRDYSDRELAIVKWSLEELSRIPINEREIVPDDYDCENPQNYPPPPGVQMVKI